MAKCKSCGRWERDQTERAVEEHLSKDEWLVSVTINPDVDNIPPISVVDRIPKNISLEERNKKLDWLFNFIEERAKDFEDIIQAK